MKSDFTLKLSAVAGRFASRIAAGNRALVLAAALGAVSVVGAPAVQAQTQPTKIGFVSTERILRDSKPAKAAQAKIESEFKRRDEELQSLANNLRNQAQKYDKDAPVLSESERIKRQRQLADLDSDLQRKRREFQEDFNRRRNEEFSAIVEKADAAIKQIAEQQGYDLIIQDAVTVSPRVDITDQVMKALGG
ncbi:MAG TPA: OmpH family outer membrane protein [Pusillimonas sp.]|uniref:OmpH family outer membrane protein n=1 Tax=unclassified Pusillimonas TaxID=2640016 RepID=UPI002604D5F6|nr:MULTISPECIES: OmpH family outer membrane protein [unclassified Pusillimonas]HLU19778.1 OmpH family outer membrane protein [Pusillimonas sp.]